MEYKTNEGSKKNELSIKDLFFSSIRGLVGAVTGFYMMFNDWRANINGNVVYHPTTPGGTNITYQLSGTIDYNSILHPLGGLVTAISIADIAYSLYKTHKINKEIEKLNELENVIKQYDESIENLHKGNSAILSKVNEYGTKVDGLKQSLERAISLLSSKVPKEERKNILTKGGADDQ